ncbi:MAG: DUF401 family protein [Nitrospira sp.]|nr:DUF401 family protein [bacterium]MBL7049917.1 DUF401 family protein [Nitrospira sp.]
MADLLRIFLVFTVMVLLLKRKWNLGIVMPLSAVLLAILYMLKPSLFFSAFLDTLTDSITLSLAAVLTLIRVFEYLMRNTGIMQKMMDSLHGLLKDRRILMASMPSLIGLLPSMGGAVFSAPMVEEASRGIVVSKEKKAFINYVFRHPWEFVSPLYPGIILAAAITSIPLRDMIILNAPYALSLLIAGYIWGLAGLQSGQGTINKVSASSLYSFIPLFMIIAPVMIFGLKLWMTMGLVVLGMYVFFRYSAKDITKSLREGFSGEIILIIIGVMTFKTILHTTGAIDNISSFFSSNNIPLLPVLFILPFLSGLLTGLTVGFVASTFPIIIGLPGAQEPGAMAFAFASGYVGVLLSPVHLCLVLTRQYFDASLSQVFRLIARSVILIMAVALALYLKH